MLLASIPNCDFTVKASVKIICFIGISCIIIIMCKYNKKRAKTASFMIKTEESQRGYNFDRLIMTTFVSSLQQNDSFIIDHEVYDTHI